MLGVSLRRIAPHERNEPTGDKLRVEFRLVGEVLTKVLLVAVFAIDAGVVSFRDRTLHSALFVELDRIPIFWLIDWNGRCVAARLRCRAFFVALSSILWLAGCY